MLNRIILVGRLVQDVELRKTNSGVAVATFPIAVDNAMSNPDGSKGTCFIDVTCWKDLADNVAKYCQKGKLVAVDGKLNQRKYTANDGTNKVVYEVVADSIKFLEGKPQEEKVEETKPVAKGKSKR